LHRSVEEIGKGGKKKQGLTSPEIDEAAGLIRRKRKPLINSKN